MDADTVINSLNDDVREKIRKDLGVEVKEAGAREYHTDFVDYNECFTNELFISQNFPQNVLKIKVFSAPLFESLVSPPPPPPPPFKVNFG